MNKFIKYNMATYKFEYVMSEPIHGVLEEAIDLYKKDFRKRKYKYIGTLNYFNLFDASEEELINYIDTYDPYGEE